MENRHFILYRVQNSTLFYFCSIPDKINRRGGLVSMTDFVGFVYGVKILEQVFAQKLYTGKQS